MRRARQRQVRLAENSAAAAVDTSDADNRLATICPLCGRALIDGPSVNEHHLVPRTFRGRHTVRMHRICHNKIHSVFSERELAQYYHTIDRLLENDEIRRFVDWVRKKDPAYYDRHRSPMRRR